MKKMLTLATLVACFALHEAKAQNVNGVRLSDIHADYIELSAEEQVFSRKIYVVFHYGQKSTNRADDLVKDDNGKNMEFNAVLELVNKMKNYGYELFQAYAEQYGKESSITKYILKRK